MFERLMFLGYVLFAVVQGALRGSQIQFPHPMTTVIPKPPIRQEATLQYFRHLDQLDNNLVYRPFASEFTTEMH